MKIAVWDTYVARQPAATEADTVMHFDILVPEGTPFEKVQAFGRDYLAEKGKPEHSLTTRECQLCHVEEASPPHSSAIKERGFPIIEMEGCET